METRELSERQEWIDGVINAEDGVIVGGENDVEGYDPSEKFPEKIIGGKKMNRNRKTRNPKTQPHMPKERATKPKRLGIGSAKRGNCAGMLIHRNAQ